MTAAGRHGSFERAAAHGKPRAARERPSACDGTPRLDRVLGQRRALVVCLAAGLIVAAGSSHVADAAGATTRVSVASDGTQANDRSVYPSISADGRFVTFYSYASNLVADDTNGATDVFVHDRQTGTTTRVSVASDGTQANDGSYHASISADGQFVAFFSRASNLVADDRNGRQDVFVHDRQSGTTERVSVASDGTEANDHSLNALGVAISADGRFVAFSSSASNLVANDWNGRQDVFVRDRESGTTERASVAADGREGNGHSVRPAISADGRFVAFDSTASNLVAGGTSGGAEDVFVRDRHTGTTVRVSVASDGSKGNGQSLSPAISADGELVAFISSASNLVPEDTNGAHDVFVHDRERGATERVSVTSAGTQRNGDSLSPALSADGRVVAFLGSDAEGTYHVFVRDRQSGTTEPVNVAIDGSPGNAGSARSALSADGRFVAFFSNASNLVTGDTNGTWDVFVRDRAPNDPPECTFAQASPRSLWPPDHAMVPVHIVGLTDPDGDHVTVTIDTVTQDELTNGLADGDASPDAVIHGDGVLLRAERSGNGNGRVYEVGFTADDGHGGACTGSVTVLVPLNMKSGSVPIDDGQSVDATRP